MRSKLRFLARFRLQLVILGTVAVAAVFCAAFVRDAVSPAEARSATVKKQLSPSPAGPGAQVRIEALGTQRNGITGRPHVQNTSPLSVGETATRFLRGGDHVSPTVCNTNFVDMSMDVEYVFLWKLEVKVVSLVADRTTMQVHWVRSHAGGQPELERDEVRTITLGPADSHVLDYVEDQTGPSSSCASLLVRISAQPIQQQNERSLAVDVWTVDENVAGETRSVHQRVEGRSGETLAYQLPPLEFVPFGVGGIGQQPVRMDLSGEFQVTVADDQFLDVGLSAARRLSYGKGTIRGEGHVQFRAKVGETAAILLPEPQGAIAATPPGLSAMDLGRLLSGRRTWLYVRIESVR